MTDSYAAHVMNGKVECDGDSCRILPASSTPSHASAAPMLWSSQSNDTHADEEQPREQQGQTRRVAESKRERYAHLRSAVAVTAHDATRPTTSPSSGGGWWWWWWGRRDSKAMQGSPSSTTAAGGAASAAHVNVIEQVYNEDFDTIDHIQAMRFPPFVAQQLRNSVRGEAQRRCAEVEKTMARCLQDKMWTTWKCQKQRDAYYKCVEDEERRHTQRDPNDDSLVDMLTANRWKYNLGVFHGEIIGRNNLMRYIWKEHFPDREMPHPWVSDE